MNFVKKLFLGSVVAMGAFGLVACGDDSSSGANSDDNIPVQPAQDNIIQFENTKVATGMSSVKKFTGQIQLSFVDTSSTNSEALQFTGITASVLKIEADGPHTTTIPVLNAPNVTSGSSFAIGESGVSVDLADTAFTECGAYALRITVNATDGIKTFENYVDIPFDRDAKYCPAETPSSSSEGPVAADPVLTPCLVEIATNGNNGVSIATCQATAEPTADLIFTKSGAAGNAIISVTSGSGLTFTINTNDTYEVGFWPEDAKATANVSDFKYTGAITGTEVADILSSNQIYIAATSANPDLKTGAGYYPFGVESAVEGNNGDRTMTIKVYKVQ